MIYGFVGLGLIGGSIAKAIKEKTENARIVAYDINTDSLQNALKDGIVDDIRPQIDNGFNVCDYIFLCAPVQGNDQNLLKIKEVKSDACILTDVGSVKSTIHEAISQAHLDYCFIGGHPMAGSERVGYINSKSSLLENAYYILTPTSSVPADKVNELKTLVRRLGAIPLTLDQEKHDYITAAISHLPHIIAASLVNLVHDLDDSDGIMKMIAAGGFKDITRIASSSATMWQQICLTNTENIHQVLDKYMNSLSFFRGELLSRDSNSLYHLFDSAREYRDSFIDASSGPIKKSFSFYVDIADKTGAIAHIATILAQQEINIKNIGISHNRETEDGILRIEVYRQDDMERAVTVLSYLGYIVHMRK